MQSSWEMRRKEKDDLMPNQLLKKFNNKYQNGSKVKATKYPPTLSSSTFRQEQEKQGSEARRIRDKMYSIVRRATTYLGIGLIGWTQCCFCITKEIHLKA
jgi:hypothetical protein